MAWPFRECRHHSRSGPGKASALLPRGGRRCAPLAPAHRPTLHHPSTEQARADPHEQGHAQALPEQGQRVLAKVRAYLASRPETAGGRFELPMVTSVIRSVALRRDAQ